MAFYKSLTLNQKIVAVVFAISLLATIILFRHFTTALMWGTSAAIFYYTREKKSLFVRMRTALRHPIFITSISYASLALLSTIWAYDPFLAMKTGFSALGTVLLFLIMTTQIANISDKNFRFIIYILGIIMVLSLFFISIQYTFNLQLRTLIGLEPKTLKTNTLVLVIFSLPLCAAFARVRYGACLSIVMYLGLLWLCSIQSYHAATVGLFLGFIVASLSLLFPKAIAFALQVIPAALCLVFPFLVSTALQYYPLDKLIIYGKLLTFIHRLHIWQFTNELIVQKPLLGWGANVGRVMTHNKADIYVGADAMPSHPHNHIMQTWLELGLCGALVLSLLHFFLFRELKTIKNNTIRFWATCYAITIFCIFLISHSIWHKWWITTFGVGTVLLARIVQKLKSAKDPV